MMASALRVALITGASGTIGRAIALRLAKANFAVSLNDLPRSRDKLDSLAKEINDRGGKSFVSTGDVSKTEDVETMVGSVVKEMGSLDVMVANAGICFGKSIVDTTAEDLDRMFSVNVRGVLLCYKYAARQMILQGKGGRIIGASSVAGKQGVQSLAAYSASKFAVRGLTQSAAVELGKHNITVNAYCPGGIMSPMLTSLGNDLGDTQALQRGEAELTPLGRLGLPEDVANVVAYLASEEAGHVTGQSLSVDGGRSLG